MIRALQPLATLLPFREDHPDGSGKGPLPFYRVRGQISSSFDALQVIPPGYYNLITVTTNTPDQGAGSGHATCIGIGRLGNQGIIQFPVAQAPEWIDYATDSYQYTSMLRIWVSPTNAPFLVHCQDTILIPAVAPFWVSVSVCMVGLEG